MRKIILISITLCFVGILNAQNVQLHYDFGKGRQMLTTTVEMFKPDKLGNTFFFIDFDYGSKDSGVEGVSGAYWEIARVIKTENMPVGFHAEYNGGLGRIIAAPGAFRINDCFLAGVDYSVNAADFSKGFSIKGLYKYIANKEDASFQITGVWYWNFFDGKITFKGFADFWKEDSDFDYDEKADACFIFLTEPQIWYKVNEHFSAGGEVEISSNFGGNDGFMVNPTLAIKYIFD
ncbi:MAG: DUF5020 family protein [Salinivirgaceae bacterium]|nr:DUF5020 family protein [Salinivirgaceae bacterium]